MMALEKQSQFARLGATVTFRGIAVYCAAVAAGDVPGTGGKAGGRVG